MAPRKKSFLAASLGAAHPSHEEISLLAYEFFLQRGSVDGWDLDDWLQAEREMLGKNKKRPGRGKKAEPSEVAIR